MNEITLNFIFYPPIKIYCITVKIGTFAPVIKSSFNVHCQHLRFKQRTYQQSINTCWCTIHSITSITNLVIFQLSTVKICQIIFISNSAHSSIVYLKFYYILAQSSISSILNTVYIITIDEHYYIPVSYTHLDVYKRQV